MVALVEADEMEKLKRRLRQRIAETQIEAVTQRDRGVDRER